MLVRTLPQPLARQPTAAAPCARHDEPPLPQPPLCGLEEAEEPEAEAKVIDGRRMEVERTIATIPAKTVAGILVKFQILVDPDPETYIGAALFVSGYHDLERLAEGGAS